MAIAQCNNLRFLQCIILLSLYYVNAQTSKHGLDRNVCDPTTLKPSTKTKPTLPNAYEVKIECNIENKNYTTDYSEYYDQIGNRAAVSQWELGFHVDGYYSFQTDELFTVESQFSQCVTDTLATSGDKFLFGYQPSSSNPNVGRLYSAYGALRFGNGTKEQYMGTSTVRGIIVDHWQSCQYWADMDATMTVDWFFSASTWDTAVGRVAVPVRCAVQGNVWENGSPRAFNHTYEFNEFRSRVPDSKHFETPSGVICPHRKLTKSLPTPSSYFTFTAEILTPGDKTIGFIKEFYDYNTSLFRYDYKPQGASIYGSDLLSEVHDYNEGIAYIMDPMIGNCSVTSIDGSGLDAKQVDANHVRIRTAKEFFYFDKNGYQYEGVKTIRGIACDVWITQRNDWPPGTNGAVNSTWEWWFATSSWTASVGHTYVFGMPVQLVMNAPGLANYVYNVYDYDEEEPAIWDFDISKCFNYTEKRDFHFKLPGKYQDTAAKNLELFKYFVLLEVHKWTDVSPLRISNMQVDFDDSNLLVSFTLLGPAFMQGDTVMPKKQVDLNTASTLLNDAINKGVFQVNVDVDTLSDTIVLTAQPYTLKQSQHTVNVGYYVAPSGTKYSGGSLAALGVCMAVGFFVVGFVAVYIYYRRKGGAFNDSKGFEPKKFENEAASDS